MDIHLAYPDGKSRLSDRDNAISVWFQNAEYGFTLLKLTSKIDTQQRSSAYAVTDPMMYQNIFIE